MSPSGTASRRNDQAGSGWLDLDGAAQFRIDGTDTSTREGGCGLVHRTQCPQTNAVVCVAATLVMLEDKFTAQEYGLVNMSDPLSKLGYDAPSRWGNDIAADEAVYILGRSWRLRTAPHGAAKPSAANRPRRSVCVAMSASCASSAVYKQGQRGSHLLFSSW
jgi:hypothetical protein